MKIEDPEDPAASKGKPREMIKGALDDLGFKLEDVLDQEPDAGLGNGGLGRLAACFVDSMATEGIPAWGYGLRYELLTVTRWKPRLLVKSGNPWEIERNEVQIPVTFYGYVDRPEGGKTTLSASQWIGGERVLAVAYDFPVPGFKTSNQGQQQNLILQKFNNGDYKNSVAQQQRAESITAVLYPNDNFAQGKELRLKQQYFGVLHPYTTS
nr:BPK_HP1_G0058180.mRNA.1.CDS.1 [Saccharomyces cerevisiae]